MKREQGTWPGQDGEERGSSPSSLSGTGKTDNAGELGGFAEGGPADLLSAGAELARLLAVVTGDGGTTLGALGDQEVLGGSGGWGADGRVGGVGADRWAGGVCPPAAWGHGGVEGGPGGGRGSRVGDG